MIISQIIREKRKQLGLTQENVAEYLGVSTPAVSKWRMEQPIQILCSSQH